MRKDIYKDGIKTQFSKTNQPSNESKRVPKWRHHLKQELLKNYPVIDDALIQKAKEGDIKAIEFIRDWIYGKNVEKIEHKFDNESLKELKDIFDSE